MICRHVCGHRGGVKKVDEEDTNKSANIGATICTHYVTLIFGRECGREGRKKTR